jgi:uncharacterized protein (DUF849 family)
MLIQAALNGSRKRSEHPAVPITPDELAHSAKQSVAAGAGAIHFHVRSADGSESLEADDVATALTAVRAAVPETPIGVSTGAWILQDAQLRHEKISRWTVLPDFASVNFKEEGAVPLATLLLSRGIEIEAGLSETAGTRLWVASGLAAASCLRVLLEPFEDTKEAALNTLSGIEKLLAASGVKIPRLLHGLNRTAWDLINEAASRGYDTRVGLEDILTLPDGTSAPGNGALVSEAVRRMQAIADSASM